MIFFHCATLYYHGICVHSVLSVCPSVTSWFCTGTTEQIKLGLGMEDSFHLSYTVLMYLPVFPKIKVFPSGTVPNSVLKIFKKNEAQICRQKLEAKFFQLIKTNRRDLNKGGLE